LARGNLGLLGVFGRVVDDVDVDILLGILLLLLGNASPFERQ